MDTKIKITDDKITEMERKIAQIPVDKRIWLDGFMEGLLRAGGSSSHAAMGK